MKFLRGSLCVSIDNSKKAKQHSQISRYLKGHVAKGKSLKFGEDKMSVDSYSSILLKPKIFITDFLSWEFNNKKNS